LTLNSEFDTIAELIRQEIQDAFLAWGSSQPLRSGPPHASALLSSEQEWCVRRYVLAQLQPDDVQPEDLKYWQWKQQAIFLHGWEIHRMLQLIFKNHLKVVMTNGQPELDLTHYDEVRNVYFSPDAILEFFGEKYVVEIKGIKQEMYQRLTDDLITAIGACETVSKAIHQANLYMHLLEIKRAIILVVNKNDSREFRLWVIEHDPLLAKLYTNRAYQVKGAVTLARAHGKLPARVCSTLNDALAKKCLMRDVCFGKETK
jgi:hypothetical protein